MRILHIAYIENHSLTGVCVAVPEHIKSQHNKAEVALLNIKHSVISGITNSYVYDMKYWRNTLIPEFQIPDIVIFHEIYHFEYIKIAKDLRKHHIPYIIIPHGSLVRKAQQKKWLKKFIANILFFNKFVNGAKAVQCLSNQELENTDVSVRKFLCTNGIHYPQKIDKSFNESELNITYIGRLEVYVKGLDILVEAVSRIAELLKQLNVKIHIYGPDIKGRYAAVESLIRENNVSDIIKLNREISGADKYTVLENTDIFIQTSRHEGMPMGILEALGMGIPCIVTKGTSLGGIIHNYDAGWVAENTIESVAYNIKSAIAQRDCFKSKSNNARRLVEENFTWDNISDQALNYYAQFSKQ